MAVNSCCILSLMSRILFRYVSIFRMRLQIYEIFIRNTDNYFELLQYLLFCHSKRLLTCPPPFPITLLFFFSFPIAGLHKRRIFVTLYPELKVNRL